MLSRRALVGYGAAGQVSFGAKQETRMTWNWKVWLRTMFAAAVLAPGLATAGVDPIGNWLRDNGTVRMAVTQCGANYCAVNTWVKRPDGPEKIGDKLILTVKPGSGNVYQGTAYDVRRQRTYRMTITLQGDSMETTGCVLFGILCKSTGWKRIN